jgi:PTH1 family peptidyl-tRNA hydrolase
MNKSGTAVREAAMYFDVPPQNLIVIYDDIDLPAGSIRIRKAGGPGTHNGMRSVVEQLGTQDFVRIRIGVGAAGSGEDLVNRVIGKVPKAEQEILQAAAAEAAEAARDIITLGADTAMNRHNHK